MQKYWPDFNLDDFDVYKSSTYLYQRSNFSDFRGPQTPHITTIFEKNLQTILNVNKSAWHIFGTIWDTFRIPTASPFQE